MDRVFYSSSVHDEREIEAVVEVLRSGPQGLWPGRRVGKMEREVAALFGKQAGVMVNSGSSALYLAIELLGLAPGSEIVTCGLTFSTDIAPIIRAGLVPVFVDCELESFCVDTSRIEEMITARTGALLIPNLIGNAPDWDALQAIAQRHGLPTIEDSCDTLGPLLRGRPTGERSTMTVTSFANSHILTAGGNGGMLLLNDEDARDRALMLRRWGRRSKVQFFGSKRGERNFWEDVDGIRYDNQFIFDELAWNFEPSEMGAAFGL
jgi:CDP-6-deoxy-D-xylo-4-hexulose-3-dehydrase